MRRRRAWLGAAAGLAIALTAMTPGLAQAGPTDTPYPAVNPTDTAPDPTGGPSTKIIGGEQAYVKDHPYIIAMLREGGARPQGQTCTATVVAKRVIVTAAHCKDGQGAKSMLYGSDDLTKPGGTRLTVKEYIQHPSYVPPNGWQQGHDVGIVVTNEDIPVPAGFQYPKVASSQDSALTEPGKNSLLLGYGRVRDGENEFAHLKKVENFPIVNANNTCSSFGSFNGQYMVCGGYQDGHDGICQGDSGGPMLVDGVVVGVASWVKTGCGSYGAWGKLTGTMGDWANEEIKKHSTPTDPGTPTASFTNNCSTIEPKCDFDASASKDSDGSISSYKWEFGDGQSGDGVKPSHTYAKAGKYAVKLTVTDNEGKSGTTSKEVTAGQPPNTGQPPSASFSVFCQWANCQFDGNGSSDPDKDIDSYAWEFGDGQAGTGATTSHTYPNRQATYTARLTVKDRGGNSNSATKQVQCWSFGSQAFCFSQ
ncbi:secreted trypsin-like serine protease [Herbihabitans rhizosphaerae]|uniref:Secreted trypsin-like serine protease n=1 Tax=Herbihabitans rhizosphaerae TaxID=1872711 RepID=A0A4Q7KE76_9PSEU|nr:PKD domain-containing protein [Herbihabitans rhizosphaerae]RZS30340.1 secreted trypsin-like serine protease [Herbihabitans rhizosphaerae]